MAGTQALNNNMQELCAFMCVCLCGVHNFQTKGQGESRDSHNYVIKKSDIWNLGAIK